MNTFRLLALTAALPLVLPVSAMADNYLRFAYTLADYDEQDMEFTVASPSDETLAIDGYDPGGTDYLSVAGGTWLSPNLRAEVALDFSLASKEDDGVTVSSGGASEAGTFEAKTTSHLLMINGYYHFMNDRGTGAFDPYVGAGIGLADNELEDMTVFVSGASATIEDGGSTEFAFKFGGGVAYWLSDAASVDFSIFYVDAGTVESGDTANGVGGTVALSRELEMDLESINYSLGISIAI